ncbi:MAG: ABC transporter ATP-binding protein [Xanthomonadales bacterium]|nr:ABC transporter ATP-binding protein [Xanthomonadales bacterium]NNL94162.1 ABC transporter ATP-binding protein [Xanthomonadales bacterium]
MSGPALQVSNLEVAFRRGGELQPVVDGVSLELAAGQISGLVGESGCGKSVTAQALMGLLPARSALTSATSLRINGEQLAKASARQWRAVRGYTMAMIFQEPDRALDPVFTVGTQIGNVIRRRDQVGKTAAREQSLKALAASGFAQPESLLEAYPHQLSGGMRQLIMIAMAIAVRPVVLIADEPTTALDVTTQALVLERLTRLTRRYNTAILLVTHDLGVAARCCSEVMVMYCGRLVEQGDYRGLFRHARHPYTSKLLAAVPRVGAEQPPRGIAGRVPALSEIPRGCRFAPRCSRADSSCRASYPPLEALGSGRVACHHPL